MSLRLSAVFAAAIVIVGSAASTASAQDRTWGDFGVSLVAMQYDLSGTGNAPGIAARISRDLSPGLSLEFRSLFAKPEQQVGRSTLIVPEAQLQYRWNIARVSPFVGGGIGAAFIQSPFRADWDPTLSAAAGAHVRLTERVGLIGELRLRGVEWEFSGSVAEWSAGLTWRLPSY